MVPFIVKQTAGQEIRLQILAAKASQVCLVGLDGLSHGWASPGAAGSPVIRRQGHRKVQARRGRQPTSKGMAASADLYARIPASRAVAVSTRVAVKRRINSPG